MAEDKFFSNEIKSVFFLGGRAKGVMWMEIWEPAAVIKLASDFFNEGPPLNLTDGDFFEFAQDVLFSSQF